MRWPLPDPAFGRHLGKRDESDDIPERQAETPNRDIEFALRLSIQTLEAENDALVKENLYLRQAMRTYHGAAAVTLAILGAVVVIVWQTRR